MQRIQRPVTDGLTKCSGTTVWSRPPQCILELDRGRIWYTRALPCVKWQMCWRVECTQAMDSRPTLGCPALSRFADRMGRRSSAHSIDAHHKVHKGVWRRSFPCITYIQPTDARHAHSGALSVLPACC